MIDINKNQMRKKYLKRTGCVFPNTLSKYVVMMKLTMVFLTVSVIQVSGKDPRPNVILIYADDIGFGDLGCYGATKVKTPHIDRLANQGRQFTDMHTASSVCTPSRYALLTGEYPFRVDLFRPVFDKQGLLIDTSKLTLAKMMKNSGYTTAAIGKWHLGFGVHEPDWNGKLKPGPLELGFDYYFGIPTVNSHPPFVYVENHGVLGFDPKDPFVYGEPAETMVFDEKMNVDKIGGAAVAHRLFNDEFVGTTLTEKAVGWIKDNSDRPFFLYFPTTNIHHPFTPHPQFQGSSESGRYGDFIHELDWIVGEIMNVLEEENLADNTLIIFTSDNGGMINRGGQDAIKAGHRLNGDLLGFKFDAWEGGHRVPMIARWPQRIAAGSKSDQLIANVDIFHSLASLIGYDLADKDAPDSFDLLPVLLGETNEELRDHLVIAPLRRTNMVLRMGDWVFINAQGGGGFSMKNVGDHGFGGPPALRFAGQVNSDVRDRSLIAGAPTYQLYDLGNDPRQAKNIASGHPDVVSGMQKRLDEIINNTVSTRLDYKLKPIPAD